MATTVILPGESLFDVAVRVYGHTQGVAILASDNGISVTEAMKPGIELIINDTLVFDLPVVVIQAQTVLAPNELVSEPYQNIFDLAVQAYGDIEGLVFMSSDNNKGLTAQVSPGDVLHTRNQAINKLVVNFFKGHNTKIATGLTPEEESELVPEGIDFWAIETEFLVS